MFISVFGYKCFSRMNIFDRPMIFFILSQIHYHNPRQRKRSRTVWNYIKPRQQIFDSLREWYTSAFIKIISLVTCFEVFAERTLLLLTKSVDNFTKHHLGNFYSQRLQFIYQMNRLAHGEVNHMHRQDIISRRLQWYWLKNLAIYS